MLKAHHLTAGLVVLSLAAGIAAASAAETATKTFPTRRELLRRPGDLGRITDQCTILLRAASIAICRAAGATINTACKTNTQTRKSVA
jgi:hypothetical protein